MAKDIMNEELKQKKPFNKRKLKYGVVSTIIVIVFIAVVVVLNVVVGVLTERKNLKLDLTDQKYYEVSQETLDYLAGIDTEVEIAVMAEENDFLLSNTYMKMVLETMKKYENASDKITLNFYDIITNPDVAAKFSKYYNGEITQSNIVIVANERAEVLNVNDLFTITSDYYSGTSSIDNYKGEQELTSAIMTVTDANPQTVALVSLYNGSPIFHQYNQYSVLEIKSLLDKNGYEVVEVDLMTGELSPEEYDIAVLPAPVNDLTENDIKKLEDFLYNGGNLDKDMIYIASTYQYATPNINDFLEVWGVEIGDSIVYEYSEEYNQYVTTYLGQGTAPIAQIAEEEFSAGLSNTKLPVVVPSARPINLLWDANTDRETTALLKTTDTGFAYPKEFYTPEEEAAIIEEMMAEAEGENADEEGAEAEATEAEEPTEETTEFDIEAAEKSAQTLMAVSKKLFFDADNVTHENNLMVIGSTLMLDPNITSVTTYNNAEYVINAINKMCGKESSVIIAEKDLTTQPISVTADQKSTITNVIYFIPIAILVVGALVIIRRRNR